MLRLKYIAKLPSLQGYFGDLKNRFEAGEVLDPPALSNLQTEVHNLAGSGATFGFPDITNAAREFEDYLTAKLLLNHPDAWAIMASLIESMNVKDTLTPHESVESLSAEMYDEAVRPKVQYRVLVAEDDDEVSAVLKEAFEQAGCVVVCRGDGLSAWETMQAEPFHLVVLDSIMPGVDGATLLSMMNEVESLSVTPVVFLTAQKYGSQVLDVIRGGALTYITKPFEPQQVVKQCLRLLEPL